MIICDSLDVSLDFALIRRYARRVATDVHQWFAFGAGEGDLNPTTVDVGDFESPLSFL